MKKNIIVGLAVIILLSLTSCDNSKYNLYNNKKVENNEKKVIDKNILKDNPKTDMSGQKMESIFPETDLFATIKTNKGEIKVKFFTKEAPITVANFVGLANNGYYDGVIFHRIISNFMIQGGDPDGTGMGGSSIYGDKFADEFGPDLKNNPYTLSMANAGPNTNGSQFFINVAPNNFLDGKHAVFAEVVEGKEIVDTIKNVKTTTGDRPVEDVIIEGIKVTNEDKEFKLDIEKAKSNYNIFNAGAKKRQEEAMKIQQEAMEEQLKQIESDKKEVQKKALKTKADIIISSGSIVSVNYKGTLDNGEIFDSSEGKPALEFQAGAGQMIPGFDKAVIGMKIGEKKSIKIKAIDAYGEDEVSIPRAEISQYMGTGTTAEAGKPLTLTTGAVLEVISTDKDSITIKNNHPLANKDLNFDIEIIDIK